MTIQITTHTSHPRPARPRWRRRRGTRAAVLSLALTAGAASGLAAAPAWAAGGYHITASIDVGGGPQGVAVSPDGTRAYVTNSSSDSVSVVSTATNHVTATIGVGGNPIGVAVSPDGTRGYVTNEGSHSVSVINTANGHITVAFHAGAGGFPHGVAVSPDGTRAYVTNTNSGSVSVIGTATNQVIATIPGISSPVAVAAGRDGTHIYVTNDTIPGTVSVITRQ